MLKFKRANVKLMSKFKKQKVKYQNLVYRGPLMNEPVGCWMPPSHQPDWTPCISLIGH